ncbi:MAG: ABC transporter ATP-binding protein [Chitinophagaceae bacterium]|nr:MAG: ABC transporter ATP-binding protein [Chitinophagaceae bacterium]
MILQAENISKSFRDQGQTHTLSNISLSIKEGEFVSIMGKSGCGKSTLLYILSTMDTDYEGALHIDGELMTGASGNRLAAIRNEKIGFVFQFHYLLTEFSVLRNVMLPGLKLNRNAEDAIEEDARRWLRLLNMEHAAQKRPNQLSGGEKQRVAIARALINKPRIVMADEPTGNLDRKNTDVVFNILQELNASMGQALLIVTHDPQFAARTHRIIEMEDGRIVQNGESGED